MLQHFQVYDILSVMLIISAAVLWLMHIFVKMHKNKCATICSGCTRTSCNSKTFTKAPSNILSPSNSSQKVIVIHHKNSI